MWERALRLSVILCDHSSSGKDPLAMHKYFDGDLLFSAVSSITYSLWLIECSEPGPPLVM
jgi:hypothetical protein